MNASKTSGCIKKPLNSLLRLEGMSIFLASCSLYFSLGFSWKLFLILFFFPDISFVGYFLGKRMGAISYNIFHSYLLPLLLGSISFCFSFLEGAYIALIWTAHIGFDRMLGYGLKYTKGFQYTHLGVLNGWKSNPSDADNVP